MFRTQRTDSLTQVSVAVWKITEQSQEALKIHSSTPAEANRGSWSAELGGADEV